MTDSTDTIETMPPLTPETRAALERLLEADTSSAADPAALVRMLGQATARLDADDEMLRAVMAAQAAGVSWKQIGASLGINESACRSRYYGRAADLAGRKAEIAKRKEATAKRARVRATSIVPTDLPGMSVAEYAAAAGLTPTVVYRMLDSGKLAGKNVELDDGRRYRRVLTPPPATISE
ncbi:MAG: hypothetical protein JWM49_2035 [Microbacteriaceae bacterium]|nr:hypothetical protein [Microbacteriaceae bacterium]